MCEWCRLRDVNGVVCRGWVWLEEEEELQAKVASGDWPARGQQIAKQECIYIFFLALCYIRRYCAQKHVV